MAFRWSRSKTSPWTRSWPRHTDSRIELPASGTRYYDSYSFPLEGRVTAGRSLIGLGLFHAGTRLNPVLKRRPRSGGDEESITFSWPVNGLAMPASFEAEVRGILEDRTQVPLVTIRGRREPLDTGFEPTIQPLSITSLARSGSTVLIRALERHPGIAACPAFEYESRVSLYWLSVLRDLSEPTSYRHQLVNSPGTPLDGTEWWRAGRRPLPPALVDMRLEQVAGRDAVRQMAAHCQAQIDLVHRRLADRFGSPEAAYFAEKTIAGPILSLLDELYPDGREIVLIRDFRDQLCSVIDFFSREGLQEVQRDKDRVTDFVRQARKFAMALLDRSRRSTGPIHVLRYEDMVLAPSETFSALLEYLALPRDAEVLAGMADAVERRDHNVDSHRTVPDAVASVGRWRRDLEPDVAATATDELRAALDAFGYS